MDTAVVKTTRSVIVSADEAQNSEHSKSVSLPEAGVSSSDSDHSDSSDIDDSRLLGNKFAALLLS